MKNSLRNIFIFPFRLIWFVMKLPFRLVGWLINLARERIKRSSIFLFMTGIPDERPVSEAIAVVISAPMEILAHLDVFRNHLLRASLGVAIAVGGAFFVQDKILSFLAGPVHGLESLQAIEVTEQIGVFMRVAMFSGLVLAIPYIAFEIWLFAAPALMPRSRQVGLCAIPVATLLFAAGMAFAYEKFIPSMLPILQPLDGVRNNLRASSYFEFITGVMFWMGLVFEFPLLIFVLSAIGVVKPRFLLQYWRIAVILIAVLAAVGTPTPDPITMAMVMAPMVALYFLSIAFGWVAVATIRRPVKA
jgi:sec-independent protein translocase protein TatC